MKFCPNCETRMKSRVDEGIVFCPKCGTKIDSGNDFTDNTYSASARKGAPHYSEQESGSLKVIETDQGPSVLPTTAIDCTKCGNNTAYWWMLQTRSADEATTQFYRCTKCNHTWRNYS
ncbi:MAG TPA: transcription factor S [Nitrososphaeraceae archaeon]